MTIEFSLTKDDYLKMAKLIEKSLKPLFIVSLAAGFQVTCTCLMVFLALKAHTGPVNDLPYIGLIMVGVLYVAGVVGMMKGIINIFTKPSARINGAQDNVAFNYNEQQITTSTCRGQFILPWEKATNYKENDDYIIVFEGAKCIPIPKRAFQSQTQLSEFIALLKRKCGELSRACN